MTCGGPLGLSSPGLNGMNKQRRWRANPDTTETDFEAGDPVEFVVEDGALVEFAVAVGVLENQDAGRCLRVSSSDTNNIPQPKASRDRRGKTRRAV